VIRRFLATTVPVMETLETLYLGRYEQFVCMKRAKGWGNKRIKEAEGQKMTSVRLPGKE
jgi:hypothetical protein